MLAMLAVAAALISRSVHTRASNEDQFDSQYNIVKIFHEDDMTPEFTEQLASRDHSSDLRTQNEIINADKYRLQQNEVKTTSPPPRPTEKPSNVTLTHVVQKKLAPVGAQKANASRVSKKMPRNTIHDEVDIVDREDHVTQYLSDMMVNTDSEITSLQATESEDERVQSASSEVKEDAFFAFLTGLEKALEVDGVWSRPNYVEETQKLPSIETEKLYSNINMHTESKYNKYERSHSNNDAEYKYDNYDKNNAIIDVEYKD